MKTDAGKIVCSKCLLSHRGAGLGTLSTKHIVEDVANIKKKFQDIVDKKNCINMIIKPLLILNLKDITKDVILTDLT